MSVQDAHKIFLSAVAAVQPRQLIKDNVSLSETSLMIGNCSFDRSEIGRLIVIGAGKAAAAMAVVIEEIMLPVIHSGLVITKYGHSLPLQKIRSLEAGHPVPDEAGLEATARMLSLVNQPETRDLVIFLVSGGASALMVDVPDHLQLDAIQELIRNLLASGATIDEINCVRKHLSRIKGGQLSARVFPARLVSLILSDVNGDDLSVIASGPTAADPSTFSEAVAVLQRYQLDDKLAPAIKYYLLTGIDGIVPETIKPGDARLGRTNNFLIGTNELSLVAAEKTANASGYHTEIINKRLEGEAEEQAINFVDACLLYRGPKPACLLMGGETTVTIKGKGLGGRNQHFALAALCELIKRKSDRAFMQASDQAFMQASDQAIMEVPDQAIREVPDQTFIEVSDQTFMEVSDSALVRVSNAAIMPVILSGGTDGTDGPTDATGAVIHAGHLQASGTAARYLADNDAYHFFDQYGGLIKTGPTQTNVMDVVIAIVR